MGIPIAVIFTLAVGVNEVASAKLDDRNITIECALPKIDSCFNHIPGLGGGFTFKYDQSNLDVNRSCNAGTIQGFNYCIQVIPQTCVANQISVQVGNIQNFVGILCRNNSWEQKNFQNSSECYNKYQVRRRHCVQTYRTSKMDAKSLCCESIKTQKCLKSDLKNVCPQNYTSFQDQLIDIYSSPKNVLCKPYEKSCNGVALNFVSLACLILVVKVSLLNWI